MEDRSETINAYLLVLRFLMNAIKFNLNFT